MSEISCGGIIARMLKIEGVSDFFAIVDGTYNHFITSCVNEGIKMYSQRHESVGAHMAGAYARMTGKLGVFAASNGPGVANVLSGAIIEHLEGNRVLLITSSRRTGCSCPDRIGAYQQFDQHAVIKNMSKFSIYVRDYNRIQSAMQEALRACYEGRPGLVHVDVPENVMNSFGKEPLFLEPKQYRRIEPISLNNNQVQMAAQKLATAQRPFIHMGSGVMHTQSWDKVAQIAEKLNIPVVFSWAAKGGLPDANPHVVPSSMSDLVTNVRVNSDLCLCLGSMLGETDYWGKFPYWAKTADQYFIQVDHDAANIGRHRRVNLGINGDVELFMTELLKELEKLDTGAKSEVRATVINTINGIKQQTAQGLGAMIASLPTDRLHILQVLGQLRKFVPADTVIVTDGGNTAGWCGVLEHVTPNCQLNTWHMGHLGAGPGYALGAAIARPKSQVCLITGDGAYGMHMQELETAVRYGLKILVIVAADKQWGMVKVNQITAMQSHKERYKNALNDEGCLENGNFGEVAWDQVAIAMGAHGERVRNVNEITDALTRCLQAKGPALLMLDVDPASHLQFPGLKGFKEMHDEPAGEDGMLDQIQTGSSC